MEKFLICQTHEQGRQSIQKSGGTDSEYERFRSMLPKFCYLIEILKRHLQRFGGTYCIKSLYSVHDLKENLLKKQRSASGITQNVSMPR